MTLLQLKNFLPLITYRIKIRIGEPKPFPQTQDDIVDVKRLATTGFYQIISLKNEKRLIKNSRIHSAFIEYPYYIIYMHYWLKQKECWLKGCSVNQSGIDFTSNLVASWHSILNEKVLNKSRMARADIIIYTLSMKFFHTMRIKMVCLVIIPTNQILYKPVKGIKIQLML